MNQSCGCLRFCVVLAMLFCCTKAYAQEDSSAIKIRVDLSDVVVQIDGDSLRVDSYGNQLTAGNWAIFNRPAGTYTVTLSHPEYNPIDTNVTVGPGEVATLDLRFLEAQDFTVAGAEDTAQGAERILKISSVPDSLALSVDGDIVDETTPHVLTLDSGVYEITAFGEGWEPLSYTAAFDTSRSIDIRFILRSLPPPRPAPESLGLAYEPQVPLIDVKVADNLENRFKEASATFLVFPFSQGLVMKALLDDDQQNAANAFLISGAVLSAGSYFLGKIFSSHKRNSIMRTNEQIAVMNQEAEALNKIVEETIDSVYQEALLEWESRNEGKGVVEVKDK